MLQVWLAKCKPLDEDVALKIIEMDNMACDLVRMQDRAAWPHSTGEDACNQLLSWPRLDGELATQGQVH